MNQTIQEVQESILDFLYDFKKSSIDFLEQNRVWPMFIVIATFSFVMSQAYNNLSMFDYIKQTIVMTVLMIPLLIFQSQNVSFKKFPSILGFFVLLAVIHVIYPAVIELLMIDDYFLYQINQESHVNHTPWFIILFIILIISNIVLYKIPNLLKSKIRWQQIMNLHSTKVYAVILAFFSVVTVLINEPFQQQLNNYSVAGRLLSFIFTSGQFFMAYAAYYVVYFIHHHVVFNYLLKKKGIFFYIAGILGIIFMVNPIINAYVSLFPNIQVYELHPTATTAYLLNDINIIPTFITLLISLPLIILIEWNKQTSSISMLLQEKTDTELSLLKQQINPHFFFNTLNNLYSMSLTNEKETSNTILQLSELMRYVIYKGKEDEVTLEDDIKYIEDYVRLQSIRLHKKLDYSFDYPEVDASVKIPPLLFIIFVENAFKHGIEPAEGDCFLHLKLEHQEDQLIFTCHNSVEQLSNESQGIGLENLRKRLDLLFEEYDLNIIEEPNNYKVSLSFDLYD